MNEKDELKKIDINEEDLPQLPILEKLIVNLEDLSPERESKVYPGFSDEEHIFEAKDKPGFGAKAIWHLVLAGLVGGFVGWVITELFYSDAIIAHETYIQLLIEISCFTAIIGGTIGALLGSVEGLSSKVSEKAVKGFAVALVVGLAGGAIGGVIGQLVYSFFGGGYLENIIMQIAVRAVAWGLVGLFVGIGQGFGTGGGKKVVNGLLGGLVGGLIGGFLFDIIGLFTMTGMLSRAVAIPAIGACTGFGIGIVQEIRKEAWLKVLQGATSGKEYIVFGSRTVLGSSTKCDIVLVQDPEVAPMHAEISLVNKSYIIRELNNAAGVWVGRHRVTNQKLKNGDMIKIGQNLLQFFERQVNKSG